MQENGEKWGQSPFFRGRKWGLSPFSHFFGKLSLFPVMLPGNILKHAYHKVNNRLVHHIIVTAHGIVDESSADRPVVKDIGFSD
jgi:hypothetical protein